jgi:hypothetical protein
MKNIHLVPQAVIDCAENLLQTKNENTKTSYTMRLEAIRDYCDEILKKQNNVTFTIRKKNATR